MPVYFWPFSSHKCIFLEWNIVMWSNIHLRKVSHYCLCMLGWKVGGSHISVVQTTYSELFPTETHLADQRFLSSCCLQLHYKLKQTLKITIFASCSVQYAWNCNHVTSESENLSCYHILCLNQAKPSCMLQLDRIYLKYIFVPYSNCIH